jgi:hypothetical protein
MPIEHCIQIFGESGAVPEQHLRIGSGIALPRIEESSKLSLGPLTLELISFGAALQDAV